MPQETDCQSPPDSNSFLLHRVGLACASSKPTLPSFLHYLCNITSLEESTQSFLLYMQKQTKAYN